MTRFTLYLGGVLAPIVYAATVAAGCVLNPAHSHLADPVSLLGAPGAPGAGLVAAGWTLTGLGIAGLGVALAQDAQGPGRATGALVAATGLVMALIALAFPMDPPGAPSSVAGIGHLALVAASALGLLAAILLAARNPATRAVSGAALSTMLAGAALAGLAAARGWGLAGLGEIVTQTGYQLWFLALAWNGLQRSRTGSVA